MNIDSSGTLYKQARRQAIWAAVWLMVALVAVIARKEALGPQQWLVDQVIVLSGLLMFFQFGRMFQGLSLLRLNIATAVPQLFGRASQDDRDASAAPNSVSSASDEGSLLGDPLRFSSGREIRSFASVDEAKQHGWEFGDAVANLGDQPVPRTATLNGTVYNYDGLAPDRILSSVPLNKRVFGRLLYMQLETAAIETPPSTIIASV